MQLVPVFHELFFVLSLLFGLQTPLIAEATDININFVERSGTITYEGVITAPSAEAQAQEAIERVDTASSFGRSVEGISLTATQLHVHDGRLHTTVSFRYEDQTRMLSTFEFVVVEQEHIVFEIRDRETVVGSNGSRSDTEIRWPGETRELELEIRAEVLSPDERVNAVNPAPVLQM